MLWIVSGVTSVGKSTFLSSPRFTDVTGMAMTSPQIWHHKINDTSDIPDSAIFFYNILHPLLRQKGSRLLKRFVKGYVPYNTPRFYKDRKLLRILDADVEKKAIIVVAKRDTIVNRARNRSITERPELTGKPAAKYPDYWKSIVERCDLQKAYQAWREELERRKIPCIMISSDAEDYPILDKDSSFMEHVGY